MVDLVRPSLSRTHVHILLLCCCCCCCLCTCLHFRTTYSTCISKLLFFTQNSSSNNNNNKKTSQAICRTRASRTSRMTSQKLSLFMMSVMATFICLGCHAIFLDQRRLENIRAPSLHSSIQRREFESKAESRAFATELFLEYANLYMDEIRSAYKLHVYLKGQSHSRPA